MKYWQAVTQNYQMINDSALFRGRRIYLLKVSLVVGSPAYAEWRDSVVISWEKYRVFIKHIDYTKMKENEKWNKKQLFAQRQ